MPPETSLHPQLKRNLSPLRYPGGKRTFVPFLQSVIEANGNRFKKYVEPYAGGAGAALELMRSDTVDHIHLNDKDRSIYWIWRAALTECDRFIDKIHSIPLTLSEYSKQREVLANNKSGFDLGFAAFYLNRTSVSGVIRGSGPIGGYKQTGKYLIDCRFNRDVLGKKIAYLGEHRSRIVISNQDTLTLLKKHTERNDESLFYLDPPYYHKASELYLNSYKHADHEALRNFLLDEFSDHHWILSYDLCPEILSLYESHKGMEIPAHHSLANKGRKQEYITISERMDFPV